MYYFDNKLVMQVYVSVVFLKWIFLQQTLLVTKNVRTK